MGTSNGMPAVLVAEDEPEVRDYLEMTLGCRGYNVELAEDGAEVLSCFGDLKGRIGLVLLDIIMPRKGGLETLREIRNMDRELPVVMLSGMSSPKTVVEAMRAGATDFLRKPVNDEELIQAIEKALRSRAPWRHNGGQDAGANGASVAFVSSNRTMKVIQQTLKRIGASDVPVLLQGESGVGKEVLALQLHDQSRRALKPFLKLNCAALPSELLESELFGYERGAFTGAFKNKPGKFELADGGTIMLDEIGDMDFKLQAKLLQVLQDHQFQRLGGKETISVDVRVLAATHCDLEQAIHQGRFREDLYYRLNVINIQVPPLRERRDEILPLARLFLKKHAFPGTRVPDLTPDLERALLAHDWPGNIRELENVIRRFLVFQDSDLLVEELRFNTRKKDSVASPVRRDDSLQRAEEPALDPPFPPLPDAAELADSNDSTTSVILPEEPPSDVLTDQLESAPPEDPSSPVSMSQLAELQKRRASAAIIAALNSTRWNRKRAAALLNIDYKALLYKMKKLQLDGNGQPPIPAAVISEYASIPSLGELGESQKRVESEAILSALTAVKWNRKRAAELLQLEYKALLYKMKKLGIGQQMIV